MGVVEIVVEIFGQQDGHQLAADMLDVGCPEPAAVVERMLSAAVASQDPSKPGESAPS